MQRDEITELEEAVGACRRSRLSQNGLGSVDLCSCGTWQLNLGALSVRLAPGAVEELMGLLGQAISRHSALKLAASLPLGLSEHHRGRA